MPRISVLPENDATNGWSRVLPRREPRPSLGGDVRADWAIVGAGYAGRAAARRLAENRPNGPLDAAQRQRLVEIRVSRPRTLKGETQILTRLAD